MEEPIPRVTGLFDSADGRAQVPMRPDEIQELMNQMNQPKMAHVLPSENDEGADPPDVTG